MPPTPEHEILIKLFQNQPKLAPDLLGEVFGLDVPAHTRASLACGDFGDVRPTELRADAVVTLRTDEAVMSIIVEVQRKRDHGKRQSWPVYLTTLHARVGCPAVLLVICPDPAVARWCANPIDIGHPDWSLRPLVIGPDAVPVITDPGQAAQSPELAVLSTLTHGSVSKTEVIDALCTGLAEIDHAQARLYTEYVLTLLSGAARKYMEELMAAETFEYMSEFTQRYVDRGKAEGKAEGKANDIITVLVTRGFQVPDETRERITSCTDLAQLDEWLRRAVTTGTVDGLFD
ncbi:RpnC/YadD family protein [Allosalinactinospora lopnorensis]|uniref:hypothetical protein n=1 Tax=Allosalinactinospora lopnorensis TaxID=1352348 RepID=UPI000623F296|nr:hypothetical protein [Allosalinactinospora lopnorensis]